MMKKTTKRTIKTIRPVRPFKRRKGAEERAKEAFANVPKITNETVAEHRENVLGSARKFIYPLKHSRRRAITISTAIFVTAIIIFGTYVGLALYKFQSTSTFIYGVTKVLPMPVAKAGPSWVSYNSYLFELRRYMHYYTTQQGADFDGEDKPQLANYKKQALQQVIDDAYVKQLAQQQNVRITGRQVDEQVRLVRSQNRLGGSEQEFREVLNEFWGWDESDFRRSLQQEMLAQAVVAKLDTQATQKANTALQQLRSGTDFATLASQQTEDNNSKANGGKYPGPINPANTDIAPQLVAELAKLKPGGYSAVVNTGFALEIVKLDAVQDGRMQASHIMFNLKPASEYVSPLQKQNPSKRYIGV